jgi:hypothetical protein
MILEDLIPNKNSNWVVKKNKIYYKKGEHNLALEVIDNIVYVVIDIKISNQTIKLIELLLNKNIKFYLMFLNYQSLIDEDEQMNFIKTYLYTYINKEYYYGFKKINFNLISNLIDWVNENNCTDKIKEAYDIVHKIVNQNYFDYFSSNYIYDYPEEIRNDYNNIYRDINIELILK